MEKSFKLFMIIFGTIFGIGALSFCLIFIAFGAPVWILLIPVIPFIGGFFIIRLHKKQAAKAKEEKEETIPVTEDKYTRNFRPQRYILSHNNEFPNPSKISILFRFGQGPIAMVVLLIITSLFSGIFNSIFVLPQQLVWIISFFTSFTIFVVTYLFFYFKYAKSCFKKSPYDFIYLDGFSFIGRGENYPITLPKHARIALQDGRIFHAYAKSWEGYVKNFALELRNEKGEFVCTIGQEGPYKVAIKDKNEKIIGIREDISGHLKMTLSGKDYTLRGTLDFREISDQKGVMMRIYRDVFSRNIELCVYGRDLEPKEQENMAIIYLTYIWYHTTIAQSGVLGISK